MASSIGLEATAARLAELGHPTRLAVFRQLVRVGPAGCTVGEIQQRLGVPGSTLSHHLSKMVAVGLVEQRREMRTVRCIPCFDALYEVLDFLREECCQG